MKTISIMNRKGGAGKTTSTLNIAACLVSLGKRVLIVDVDSQCNLTYTTPAHGAKETIMHSIDPQSHDEVPPPLPIINVKENLDIVPGSNVMYKKEPYWGTIMGYHAYIHNLLVPIKKNYDYCLIDCPPSASAVVVMALSASNAVYIPVEGSTYAYDGLGQMGGLLDTVREYFNKSLAIEAIFITKHKGRLLLSGEFVNSLKELFGDLVCNQTIRYVDAVVNESQWNKKDLLEYAPNHGVTKDYMALVNELLEKEGSKSKLLQAV